MNIQTAFTYAKEAYTASPDYGLVDSASRMILREINGQKIIAFPGSNNIDCWVHDFNIDLIQTPNLGKIHAGIWEAYAVLRKYVLQIKPAFVVGHSLGAALAIVATGDLCNNQNAPIGLWAFEPPRVTVDNNLHRLFYGQSGFNLIRNGLDLVTDLPPDLINNWQHPKVLTRIGSPSEPFPNIEDHMLEAIGKSLLSYKR